MEPIESMESMEPTRRDDADAPTNAPTNAPPEAASDLHASHASHSSHSSHAHQLGNKPIGLNSALIWSAILPQGLRLAEFEAIVKLLDDTDVVVRTSVRERLESFGTSLVPALRLLSGILNKDNENDKNEQALSLLESIVRRYQTEAIEELLRLIITSAEHGSDPELEPSLVALSAFGYPETSTEAVRERLDAIALRVHALFMKSANRTELGLLMCLNQAFFEEEGFRGALDDTYYNPENTYLHALLHEKIGIPISLSSLYMLVAERAGVVLHGIGMPAHFVVYHPELDVYIDTYNNGAFLTEADCKRFIVEAGFVFDPAMLTRVSNLAIILRMARNLIFAYSRTRDAASAARSSMFTTDSTEPAANTTAGTEKNMGISTGTSAEANADWKVAVLQEVTSAIIEMMNQE
jgi:regulator of sirC expression with transglutaminase-like and TPR domain